MQLALDEQVAFVLIAGDLYDGDWTDFDTGLFFVKQAARPAHMIHRSQLKPPLFLRIGNRANMPAVRALVDKEGVRVTPSYVVATEAPSAIGTLIFCVRIEELVPENDEHRVKWVQKVHR